MVSFLVCFGKLSKIVVFAILSEKKGIRTGPWLAGGIFKVTCIASVEQYLSLM